MNILEDLYYGNLHPEAKCYDRNSEYAKFAAVISESADKLAAFLDSLSGADEGNSFAEMRHTLSRMTNAQDEINSFHDLDRFLEGLRLGAGLMLEIFVAPQQSALRDIC